MFIGHFAVALAAKKAERKTSLGTFILAAQLPDLLWPIFLLIGVEHARISPGATAVTPIDFIDYPLSHSLLADIGWGLLLGGIYLLARKNLRGGVLLVLLVISHWVLDALAHRPDLPLWPGSQIFVGLGLWNSTLATVAIELGMFAGALGIYSSVTRPRDRVGSAALVCFVAFLVFLYFGNLFGPAPPSIKAVAIAGLGIWLLVAWGYWIDRHRTSAPATPPQTI
jgi:hypothetical protein